MVAVEGGSLAHLESNWKTSISLALELGLGQEVSWCTTFSIIFSAAADSHVYNSRAGPWSYRNIWPLQHNSTWSVCNLVNCLYNTKWKWRQKWQSMSIDKSWADMQVGRWEMREGWEQRSKERSEIEIIYNFYLIIVSSNTGILSKIYHSGLERRSLQAPMLPSNYYEALKAVHLTFFMALQHHNNVICYLKFEPRSSWNNIYYPAGLLSKSKIGHVLKCEV